MINIKYPQILSALFMSLLLSVTVQARDVSNEQYVVTEAKKNYDNAKSNYDAATVLVNEQKQRIAQDQAALKEKQKKQAAAKTKMIKAQALLDKRQKELNAAWDNGGR